MTNKDKPLVPFKDWPSQTATDAQKESQEYGLQVGQAIQNEWFKGNGSCRYYDRWEKYHRLRLYARGQQPASIYQDRFKGNGDFSKLNVDWTPLHIVPKFTDLVVNGMSSRMFTPTAYAQDAMSAERRNSYQQVIEKDMIAKDFIQQTNKEFGIDVSNIPQDELPDNDEELQLHMQLKYKPAIEIAEETAITTVMDMNDYQRTKWMYDYDQTVIGWGIVKHRYSYGEGIKIEYVDPANTVHSYTEDPYFRDVFYWGEVKQVPITELKKINPNISEEEIKTIQETASAWSEEYRVGMPYNDDLFGKDRVNVLYFNYKTDKNFIWKKKNLKNGGSRIKERDESFAPPENEDAPFERLAKKEDVWYDGAMILGTDIMLSWELMENMVKPDSAFQVAKSNYIAVAPRLYKGSITSLVERMIPLADQIQLNHIKLQQVAQRVVPDGVYLDADGLTGIDLGDGSTYNPQTALDLFFTTGSVIGRSYTEDGDYNQAKVPITELNSSSGQAKIQSLIGLYNHNLNQLRDVTGLNNAADASSPDPDALVGVQKLAALNSNTATRHILHAGLDMTQELAECLSIRISDVLQYANDREEFANQIGKYNVAMLDDIKNLYLHSFGIFIEMSPDQEQEDMLERDIAIALKEGGIALEDAMEVRDQRNIKTARELLKLKKKNKLKADREAEMQNMEAQNAANIQSQQAAAQAKMQQIQAEAQAKIAIANAEAEGKIKHTAYEKDAKLELMAVEFDYNQKLRGMEVTAKRELEEKKEEAKDKRVDKQSTQQSEMIKQRQLASPPINFESSEDNLGDLDLSQFNPQ